jgi:hypothetical protein
MFLYGVGVDHDIVEVDNHRFPNKWPQDAVCKGLKRRRGITEPERHYLPLKLVFARIKSRLFTISFSYQHLVVTLRKVKL